MKTHGIRTRCRQLLSQEDAGAKRSGDKAQTKKDDVSFVVDASRDKIEEAPNSVAFETEVRQCGKGMKYAQSKLESSKSVSLPPDGYCNVNGMVGSDLGLQATLQKTHTVSGPDYIRQRKAFGLAELDKFALVFVVPPERFDNGWTTMQQFQWTSQADAAASQKQQKVKFPVSAAVTQKITETEKKQASGSIQQFVLTLEVMDGRLAEN